MTTSLTRAQNLSATIESIAQLTELYETYADDLRIVRKEQRQLRDDRPDMKRQLDDIEAEITYLRLRDRRPDHVVEIGCLHGWSTSWILRALRDNGSGTLHSYDLVEHARDRVPAGLADGRWQFVAGDVRQHTELLPDTVDYLFIDAAHTAPFARWYLSKLVAALPAGTPVSVHDVFHQAWPLPYSEPRTVLSWLRRHRTGFVTAARACRISALPTLQRIRHDLGLTEPVHTGDHNPMIFFTTAQSDGPR
ncbi:MAG: class I SAM-dependent methyltransferase [Stackebrandtia sp.]